MAPGPGGQNAAYLPTGPPSATHVHCVPALRTPPATPGGSVTPREPVGSLPAQALAQLSGTSDSQATRGPPWPAGPLEESQPQALLIPPRETCWPLPASLKDRKPRRPGRVPGPISSPCSFFKHLVKQRQSKPRLPYLQNNIHTYRSAPTEYSEREKNLPASARDAGFIRKIPLE